MKTTIENLLNEELTRQKESGTFDAENNTLSSVKVADIVFAFDNADLIHLLRERGNAIMNQKFEKMREVEQKISNLKKDNYDKLTTPVCAFITFEEEDAYILAQAFESTRKEHLKQFMNENLVFTEATEPTNIIWENRHFTDKDRFIRTIHAWLLIAVLVLISFAMIYFCKVQALKVAQKYPNVDCEAVSTAYAGEL